MKVRFLVHPPPLEFGQGEDAFQLMVRLPTAEERAAMVEALARASIVEVWSIIDRLVVGWSNVLNEQGHAIPLEYASVEPGRRTERAFSRVFGAAPLKVQFDVIAGVLAFIGFPQGALEGIGAAFGAPSGVRTLTGPELDPTTPPASDTPANGPTH